MLTEDQLADELRTQLHHELSAIEPGPDLLSGVHRRRARRARATRVSLAAVPAAAVAVASALIVGSAGGGAAPGTTRPAGSAPASPAVLTAAMVNQVASQSRQALALSGRATISYRLTDNGTFQAAGSDRITFAGQNWNDKFTQFFHASPGAPAHNQTAINRVVDGRLYLHIRDLGGPDGNQVRWYHDTNPAGHPTISRIHDPRTLFGLLNPSAKFRVIGHRGSGASRQTELRATAPPQLRDLNWLPGNGPGGHVVSLTVWVDAHHVVQQMSLTTVTHSATNSDGDHTGRRHLLRADVSVTFGGFGQTQVIPVPPRAIPLHVHSPG